MLKIKRTLLFSILAILLIFIPSDFCYSNSAEPPSILIIVPNTTSKIEVGLGSKANYSNANIIDKGMEKYFVFYSRDLKTADNYVLKIKTDDSAFEIPIVAPLESFNNIFTLDLKNKTLISGKLLSRSILLVSLRIALTLIIEGIIFYLMGFRLKKSWLIFLTINLFTQGVLNIWINSFPPLQSYIIISLILGEIFVFIFEIIAFLAILREHSSLKRLLFVLIANTISLIAGGYLISVLPI